MNVLDANTTLVDGYLRLLNSLSADNKLDLISKLSLSIKTNNTDKKKLLQDSFGAFESNENAEELIAQIRNSRTFTRQIESF